MSRTSVKVLANPTHRALITGFCVVLLVAGAGTDRMSLTAQTPGGRETPKVITHPRVKSHRSSRRPPTKQSSPSTVSLLIISNPPNAKLYIDGEPRGETDANGEAEVHLMPSIYKMRLSRDGYVEQETEVEILGSPRAQEIDFTLAPALSSLNIVTDPPGAEVYLDDVYKGTTNSSGVLVIDRLNPGQPHKLRITKTGYSPQSDIPITTYSGQFSVKLLADSVRVRVNTDPPDTEVYLDDTYKGTSTADGALMIDQVNPNASHRVRGKKAGYLEQIRVLAPNNSEMSIKLLPDPLVLLVKDIKQQLSDMQLAKAAEGYEQLITDAPDNPELPRLLENILQSLQLRSTETLKRSGPFGLVMMMSDLDEIKKLYDKARKWRPEDDSIETFGKYWDMRLALSKANQSSSTTEKEALRKNAQSLLIDVGQRNVRNIYLLQEFGWAWLKLGDSANAQKNFSSAQELKPDWAYPYFASAVTAMMAGDRELNKKSKLMKYGEAIIAFTKAIERKQDFSRAYALRAIAYAYMKNHPEASASGLQAVTIDPKSAYAHFALGFAYFQKGGKANYRNAKDEFESALSLDSGELDQGARNSIQERLAIIHKSIK